MTGIILVVASYAFISFGDFGKIESIFQYKLARVDMPNNTDTGEVLDDLRVRVWAGGVEDFCERVDNYTKTNGDNPI